MVVSKCLCYVFSNTCWR